MKKYILLAATSCLLAACNNDENYIDEPVAARITASINEGTASRATDIKWSDGDCIGITMSDRYSNIKYATENEDGIFTGTTMYFRNKREPVTITAYYPFGGPENQTPAVVETSTGAERQTADEQPKFDFLYATLDGVTGAQPDVNLVFSHMMSKITLIFQKGNDGTDVSLISSYTIEGLITEGSFNPVTGACAATTGAEAKPISMTLDAVQDGKSVPPLILFPQAANKATLKIKDSENQDYICDLNFGENGLVSGSNYQFTILVKKTGLSVNPSIQPWKTEDATNNAISDDSDD